MKSKFIFAITCAAAIGTILLPSCNKDTKDDTDVAALKKEILNDVSNNICTASYEDLANKSAAFLVAATAFNTTPNDANLAQCRQFWKDIRSTWETSEAWLFGPVKSNDIDPRIDTWPVDFTSLENVLSSPDVLNEAYISGLEESLKGFHPIEYMLWGKNGNKTAADFNAREKEYLIGLTQNLAKLCVEAKEEWTTGGYNNQLITAGSGSVAYPTLLSAYQEINAAMVGICEEVGGGKIKDPFDAQDPLQEESPFAKNSIIDFTNNIKGVLNMYQGNLGAADGKGIEDLVKVYNLSLDNEIKTKHAAAIASLQAITIPFGEAIITQQTQVINAMAKITELKVVLDEKLEPFLQQYAK